MIFLTAPPDVQGSLAYESGLNLLRQRHDHEWVAADWDLFEDMNSYNKTWKQVYDPEKADGLSVLAREDGTIGHGTYRQWKRLAGKHDAPASPLLPHGEQATGTRIAEVGEFTVSAIEEFERGGHMFAVVITEPDSSSSSGSNCGKKKAAGESPGK